MSQELISRLDKQDAEIRKNAEAIVKLETAVVDQKDLVKSINKLTTGLAVYTNDIKHLSERIDIRIDQVDKRIELIEERQEKTGLRVNAIENIPAQKWDKLWKIVMSAVVLTLAGFVAYHLGFSTS